MTFTTLIASSTFVNVFLIVYIQEKMNSKQHYGHEKGANWVKTQCSLRWEEQEGRWKGNVILKQGSDLE